MRGAEEQRPVGLLRRCECRVNTVAKTIVVLLAEAIGEDQNVRLREKA